MMRWKLLIVCLLTAVSARAQMPVRTDATPYAPGETLSFSGHYKWRSINADVGKATLSLTEEDGALCGAFACQTAKFFDIFFKVREDFRSWFTPGAVKPLRFHRDSREGSYYAVNEYRYDWEKGVIHADIDTKSRGKSHLEIPCKTGTFDFPSLLYYVRQMDIASLEVGKRYPVEFAIADGTFTIFLTYRGREDLTVTGLGRIHTLKFACSLLEGNMFEGDDEAALWFSDDGNRIPVFAECEIWKGKAQIRLTGWEGLKHEFTALVTP